MLDFREFLNEVTNPRKKNNPQNKFLSPILGTKISKYKAYQNYKKTKENPKKAVTRYKGSPMELYYTPGPGAKANWLEKLCREHLSKELGLETTDRTNTQHDFVLWVGNKSLKIEVKSSQVIGIVKGKPIFKFGHLKTGTDYDVAILQAVYYGKIHLYFITRKQLIKLESSNKLYKDALKGDYIITGTLYSMMKKYHIQPLHDITSLR